ncbi:hypothetical protein ACFFRR_000042 [Megaselia abdita]
MYCSRTYFKCNKTKSHTQRAKADSRCSSDIKECLLPMSFTSCFSTLVLLLFPLPLNRVSDELSAILTSVLEVPFYFINIETTRVASGTKNSDACTEDRTQNRQTGKREC